MLLGGRSTRTPVSPCGRGAGADGAARQNRAAEVGWPPAWFSLAAALAAEGLAAEKPHPRVWTQSLAVIALPQWESFLRSADASLAEKPYAEPAGYPSAAFDVDEWRRIDTPAKAGSSHLARVALAYRVTGEAKYLEGAHRWMLMLASWDPRGVTSHRLRQPNGSSGNDAASMPILDRMSLAWDWAGDQLTAEERAKVLAAMRERGNQVLDLLQRIDSRTHPFSNHEGGVLAFLGDAGISFLGDLPDAKRWLDYVLRGYPASYPAWGGDEGGWAQGLSYWDAATTTLSNGRMLTFIRILTQQTTRMCSVFTVISCSGPISSRSSASRSRPISPVQTMPMPGWLLMLRLRVALW